MNIGVTDYPDHFHKSFKDNNEGLVDPVVIRQKLKDNLEKGKIDKNLFDKANQQLDALISKSEFSSKQRESLAKEGKAMKDGSYPIRNESDLHNAIQAFGRAKDKGKTKSWIKKRAKELGCEDCLPDEWKAEEIDLLTETFEKGEIDENVYEDSILELFKAGEGSRGGKVVRHTKSGKPVYSSTAHKQAGQFDKMMRNWHDNAHRSGEAEHHAIASKQSLVAAYYHHHAGDTIAAHDAMDHANYHRAEYEKKNHKSRITTWINKKHKETADLVGHEGYNPEDHGVHKAEKNTFEKGGEGSRGGHVIGHTKSGKAVYANDTDKRAHYKNFSPQDHIDASKLHREKSVEHELKHQNNERYVNQFYGDAPIPVHRTLAQHHRVQSQKHEIEASKKINNEQKNNLSSDEKKIIESEKKKQIAHHESMHEHHSALADLSEKAADKHKGSDNEKYMREVSADHRSRANYHKEQAELLKKSY